ncbi:MAG: HlyD family efflux transporter periplasmic adaptor subunit [Cyanophyceae cyanobacterium]
MTNTSHSDLIPENLLHFRFDERQHDPKHQPLPSAPGTSATDDDWSSTTNELLDTLPRVWTKGLLYLLMVFTGILLPWSLVAKVDETGSARGRLEPKGKTIELDAPVTGTVAALAVEEGQTIEAGQVLVELESELVEAELQQVQQKLAGLVNRLAQLELLKNQWLLAVRTQKQHNQAQALEKQAQVAQAQQHLEALQAAFTVKKTEKQAQVEQAQQAIAASHADRELAQIQLKTAHEKVPRYRQVFLQGAISQERFLEVEQAHQESQINLVKADSEIVQAESRLREQQSSYDNMIQELESEIQQAQLRLQEQQRSYQSLNHSGQLAVLNSEEQLKNVITEIATLTAEIAASESQITSLEFQLQQRAIRAPIDGTIFQLPLAEAGEVVQPGELVAQIAPEETPLILKAKIPSPESGFLRVGLPVKVKFDAYPFQDYGVVAGHLSWISPDSQGQETSQGNVETYDIEVTLAPIEPHSSLDGIVLTPGQSATAEVVIRQRRVIDFVLEPFRKLQKGGLEL